MYAFQFGEQHSNRSQKPKHVKNTQSIPHFTQLNKLQIDITPKDPEPIKTVPHSENGDDSPAFEVIHSEQISPSKSFSAEPAHDINQTC